MDHPRGRCFARAVGTAVTWRERARQRRTLASFDDRMLKDIGLGHAEAQREADKSPWRS
ncbi:MAG TPA: DUF1127 domain-containing protein [Azospirillum sp.]|nr:DUF1127 domain-containing protein [Azospirillum sp.]